MENIILFIVIINHIYASVKFDCSYFTKWSRFFMYYSRSLYMVVFIVAKNLNFMHYYATHSWHASLSILAKCNSAFSLTHELLHRVCVHSYSAFILSHIHYCRLAWTSLHPFHCTSQGRGTSRQDLQRCYIIWALFVYVFLLFPYFLACMSHTN